MASQCEVDFSDYSDDADPVEFFERRTVVARKPHRCSECGGEIAVGEKHEVCAYKFEGAFHSDRTCAPCREAAAEFEYHVMGGDLWAMLAEEWDNGAYVQACINRLSTARAKEHMQRQWVKWHDKRMERQRMTQGRRSDA